MKKLFILALAFAGISFTSQACDGGCTMGGSYLGILPQVHKNLFGVRYLNSSYTITSTYTHLHDGVPETHHEQTDNIFRTAELWGRYTPIRGMQVFAFVPYRFNEHVMPDMTHRSSGLGDVTLLANYAVINTGDSLNYTLKHTLRVGGGIKLPTGSFSSGHDHGPVSMQPGTGSTDYIVTGIYTIRFDKLGLNSDVTYNRNNKNSAGYQFGNCLSASSNLFYWQNMGSEVTLLPSAGLYYEKAEADKVSGEVNAQTGDESMYGNLGLSVYLQNFSVSAMLQKNISTTTNRDTKGNSRTQLGVAYLF
ncbi:transporter family protein [Pontibacter akesuensis]|uniref:MetA-pathway of phenol degradation n=1 Tax=Pontibacter akesuensis TaxID=388950 RepID=A0A1I7GG56_9BACT|nr:hypothetical protein [Pontibacter akesuensis]GHA57019.1 hypothetical protein GCM10007389_05860 [Pontibacter akesuensis]SFU47398.1 hypothetical protein SAMN04487941_0983 [Pontibacter akesuensis]